MVRRWTVPLAGLALLAGSLAMAPAAAAGQAAAGQPGPRLAAIRDLARAGGRPVPATPGGRLTPAATIPCTVVGPSHDLCYSTNWSGYVVDGGTFSTVTASWTVAPIKCTNKDVTDMSPWVGLDGYTSGTVEQIGTSSDCISKNNSIDYAWWEFYPAGPNTNFDTVNTGDHITATVSHSGDNYTLSMKDPAEHWTITKHATMAAQNADAEAVLEMAANHLSQWTGAQSFTGFTIDGQPAGSYETAPYTLNQFDIKVNHTGTQCDSTSGLSGGDDFSLTWLNICAPSAG